MIGLLKSLISLIYQQFAVDVDEEHRVFVSLFEYPASAVLAVNLCLYVFPADFLFGKQFVVVVEHLQICVAIHVVDNGIHYVSAYCVTDHVYVIGVVNVFVYYYNICHMIVIPV